MTQPQWSKIIIPYSDILVKEQIISLLDSLEVDSILEEDNYLEAFTDRSDPQYIADVLINHSVPGSEHIRIEKIENKNWNAAWEAGFEAVAIGNVRIRASFHDKDDSYKQEIIIKPKMAFGTGHHETTYMMIEYMQGLDLSDTDVFDFGCGTGILSVYAHMQGASQITGIDIQAEAIENCEEHVIINNLSPEIFSFEVGDLGILKAQSFHLILANINRHVLLEVPAQLYNLLEPRGLLMCSGILKSDESLIVDAYSEAGFVLSHKNYRGDWCLFVFKKQH